MKTKTVYIARPIGSFLLFSFLLINSLPAAAQQKPQPIFFKNGLFNREKNVIRITQKGESLQKIQYKGRYYVLLQFDRLPGINDRAGLLSQGIRLFDYIPGQAYWAEATDSMAFTGLEKYAVSGIYQVPADIKISPQLLANPAAYTQKEGQLIAVSFLGTMTREEAGRDLVAAGATLIDTRIRPEKVLFIRAGRAALQRIAGLPYISYIGVQSTKDRILNYNNRAAHGVDALSNDANRHLLGDGVTVGIGDDSDPYTHVDFTGRQIDRFAYISGVHGVHTSGTVAGGGILDPMYRGMAPHATIISQYFSDVLANAEVYMGDYNMVLTNNSYTAYDPGCATEGQYDFLSYYLDAQLSSSPTLLHVFAAGNDGRLSCTPYSLPFATIKSGYQCAKNVLTVGNLDNSTYIISSGSSCGPTGDGRLKPEIVAGGANITSTIPNNAYATMSGTSMASPTVAGSLALLVQRYRQLHGNTNPSAALMKALVSNTANDLGNPGPDFKYGFGSLNIRGAVEALEANHYITNTIVNGGSYTYPLTGIPAGVQQLKVLLYWPDAPAAPYATTTLVNDLDLTVTSPDAVVHRPLILNPAAASVNDIAVEGADHLNNIEQVVINNPPAGDFNLTVKGTAVPSGAQGFVLTYQTIQPSVIVEYPYGGETWVPGSTETIRWNAYGGDANTFTLEYSPDHGGSWTTISNSIPAGQRMYSWTVPATATNQGLIRVTRNGTAYNGVSNYDLTILGQPAVTVTTPCQGYAQLSWSAIPSATSYDIMQLIGDSMQKVASTGATSFLLGNLNRDSAYWLAVRAVNGSSPGRRSTAGVITPAGGPCILTALDNDYTVDSLIGPLTGRKFTSSQLGAGETIRVELKNLGTIPTGSSFSLSYRINGGSVVTESSSAIISRGGVYSYAFSTKADLSATGVYTIQTWVTYPGDPNNGNDTLTTVVKHLQNDPLTLNASYTEGFESAADAEYTRPVKGLTGMDRCDFVSSTANGRARTFVNSGFSRTGVRSAILDQAHYVNITNADSLITTFNLSAYTASDQIWLNFYYRNQGIDSVFPGNSVWIRGNDQAAWVPVYALDNNPGNIGVYQPSPNIDISGILRNASPAQTISSSFQIKFGQEGHTSANSVVTDGDLDDGYIFDDVTLTRASNDVSALSLKSPSLANICNFSNAETISILVKNYSGASLSNIPVTYSINGANVTEHIPSIPAGDSLVYTFAQKADLSAYKVYILRAWVSATGDTYASNDSLAPLQFQTVPLIGHFPYLEGFENSNGYWYTNGVNDSWQWGTPAKTIIDKAANGTKCWVTNLTGNYHDNELSYLYSPCFDLSSLANPVLSFSHIFQTEDNCMCDFHWVEYSIDGSDWTKLGATGRGVNWYDNAPRQAWQQSNTKWHVSSYDIPTNASSVRFRIVMSSDPGTDYEGVGIDDIHIFDKAAIYNDADTTLILPVSGNNWVNFDLGGQRIVSLQPNGQDLGSVRVKVFINGDGIRSDGKQYYLDRNIVIQPSTPPVDSVSVRYYFLDTEMQTMIGASGCAACSNLSDAYQAGVTQYSSSVTAEEDSTPFDNATGFYHFFQAHRNVSIIPYDNGYYAEYAVNGFSEFWISNGIPGPNQTRGPVLLSFTAALSGERGLLQWSTGQEVNMARFVIEKSMDGVKFSSLDSVKALNGDTVNTYHYADNGLQQGINYYRLKMVDSNGRYNYSYIRTIELEAGGAIIHVYPNPFHTGELHVTSSSPCRSIGLADASGRILLQMPASGNAPTLTPGPLAKGVYFIIIDTDAGRKVKKLLVK
ncbi:MAG TPA: S8 family serine peptidase [Puia sp.]|nr:S8 family serine peptidase [Puia sp.]